MNMLINDNCLGFMEGLVTKDSVIVLDPPFDIWHKLPKWEYKTLIAFTNFQNREYVTKLYGTPRVEIIWNFGDGRWVSHNFPQLNHENILIYGELGKAYVGAVNEDRTPQKKGKGCIGRDKDLGDRIYIPHDRKILNSVLNYPRNVKSKLGCWSKPEKLMMNLLEWLTKEDSVIVDPFMGSGTTGVIAKRLKRDFIGVEYKKEYYEIAEKRIRQEEIK